MEITDPKSEVMRIRTMLSESTAKGGAVFQGDNAENTISMTAAAAIIMLLSLNA